jgi:malate dehydrogenase (oxaloacetate-decarboxylating)
MMLAAARALAENSPALKSPDAPLLPELKDLRRVALEIAVAVGLEAQRTNLAPPTTPENLRECATAKQWFPSYEAATV